MTIWEGALVWFCLVLGMTVLFKFASDRINPRDDL